MKPVEYVGFFGEASGYGVAARAHAAALERAGVSVARRSVFITPEGLREVTDEGTSAPFSASPLPAERKGAVLHVPPSILPALRAPREFSVAACAWEMAELPASWRGVFEGIGELWVPSRFCAEAFRATGKPVYVIPHPVEAIPAGPRTIAGVPDDLFLFLAVFVWQDRKNPLGLLRAFRDAFGRRRDVGLFLRIVSDADPESIQRRVQKTYERSWRPPEAPVFVSLDARGSVDEGAMHHLYRRADALVSLHAAEGFGLTMAEGMAAGLPVVATRYSGNLDYMDDDSAFLVDYVEQKVKNKLMPMRDFEPHMTWAEPSHEGAVAALRACVDRPELARARASRGQRRVLEQLSPERVGERMLERLRTLGIP